MKTNHNLMALRRLPDAIRRMEQAKRANDAGLILGACVLLAFLIILLCAGLARAEVPEDIGVRCIIGEASNQGFDGLVACADALQNRGHIKGVYGCKAPHVDKEPAWVWKMARRAWQEAKKVNPTLGADHWHNIRREGPTYWTKVMKQTICIKDHCFYK